MVRLNREVGRFCGTVILRRSRSATEENCCLGVATNWLTLWRWALGTVTVAEEPSVEIASVR